MTELNEILNERGNTYGVFKNHAALSQKLKDAIYMHVNEIHPSIASAGEVLDSDMCEAIEMICHKLARIANGDPSHVDSWVDIAGYATLVADRLQGVVR